MADATMKTGINSRSAVARHYHEQTKHHFQRYARSAGSLDWANQPNPFRFYAGVEALPLPLLAVDPAGGHRSLYERSGNVYQGFTRSTIGACLELALGLSAWKSVPGSTWSLRMNPSSGNLHPTEAHLILPELPGVPGGIFHDQAYQHALEQRAVVPGRLGHQLQVHLQAEGFLMACTSIFWREAWKYGERAFRYCQHDIGHALAGLSFSANLLGWQVTWLTAVTDAEIAQLLGFHKTRWPEFESEQPEILCFIHRAGAQPIPRSLPVEIVAAFADLEFQGIPNQLSAAHLDWELIAQVAEATTHLKKSAAPVPPILARPFFARAAEAKTPAAQLIRQRRSAVAFDGVSTLPKTQLFGLLDKTLPRPDCAPFDLGLTGAEVQLLVFVHRVTGLDPGLYFWLRGDQALPALQQQCHRQFLWQRVDPAVPLYLLQTGDFQDPAITVSCQQSIAGDSAFAVGMIARFRDPIEADAARYRQLLWEAGLIGQVLYLEAEAQGLRGTGIGCFFDDPVHQLLGLKDDTFQSLYHFTVGGPLEDDRLLARAYPHLETRSS